MIMAGCVRKAFECGLKYMGRNDDLSWIPDSVLGSEAIGEIADKLGLSKLSQGNHILELRPVVVAYTDSPDDKDGHAVFVSDILPLLKYRIIAIVVGFDE